MVVETGDWWWWVQVWVLYQGWSEGVRGRRRGEGWCEVLGVRWFEVV